MREYNHSKLFDCVAAVCSGMKIDCDGLSNSQKTACAAIADGLSVFVTGSAGTGKTKLIMAVVEAANVCGRDVLICGTTAKSADVLGHGATTVHSLFGLQPGGYNVLKHDYSAVKPLKAWTHKKRVVEACRSGNAILIIDEISLMTATFANALNDRIVSFMDGSFNKETMKDWHPDAPQLQEYKEKAMIPVETKDHGFGGVQTIVVGDFLQLAPVQKSGSRDSDGVGERKDDDVPKQMSSALLIESKIFGKVISKAICLREIHRQTDPEFVYILNRIRVGRIDEDVVRILGKRVKQPYLPQHTLRLFSTWKEVSEAERSVRASELRTYDAFAAFTKRTVTKPIKRRNKAGSTSASKARRGGGYRGGGYGDRLYGSEDLSSEDSTRILAKLMCIGDKEKKESAESEVKITKSDFDPDEETAVVTAVRIVSASELSRISSTKLASMANSLNSATSSGLQSETLFTDLVPASGCDMEDKVTIGTAEVKIKSLLGMSWSRRFGKKQSRLCAFVGCRVRCLLNLGPKVYNGAMGTIVGFLDNDENDARNEAESFNTHMNLKEEDMELKKHESFSKTGKGLPVVQLDSAAALEKSEIASALRVMRYVDVVESIVPALTTKPRSSTKRSVVTVYTESRIRIIPWIRAHASTVHGVQGMTCTSTVETGTDVTFEGGFYVSVSRATELDNITLRTFHPSDIRTHPMGVALQDAFDEIDGVDQTKISLYSRYTPTASLIDMEVLLNRTAENFLRYEM